MTTADDVVDADDAGVDLDLLSSWTFVLPAERIASAPLPERAASRLLHLDADGRVHHRAFTDLVDLLEPGAVLVMNDTSVIPARLFGHKVHSGGKVELLLVRRLHGDDGAAHGPCGPGVERWVCLLGASKTPKPGNLLRFGDEPGNDSGDTLDVVVVGPMDGEPGAFVVDAQAPARGGDVVGFAKRRGALPLPPYLGRAPDEKDGERYQTVFRDVAKEGSVAAPTAGLHFDEALLERLRNRGVQTATVTLHVGPGTFVPVRTDRLSQHVMHPEAWWLPDDTAAKLNAARAAGKRIIAVGTTAARTLESARAGLLPDAPFVGGRGLTRLFIKPGSTVTAFDALITNFHLPESTLLVLVGTFVGRDRILRAYDDAIAAGYRFYSYGDACLLERPTRAGRA